jgi:hypothetical protein
MGRSSEEREKSEQVEQVEQPAFLSWNRADNLAETGGIDDISSETHLLTSRGRSEQVSKLDREMQANAEALCGVRRLAQTCGGVSRTSHKVG